MQWSWPFQRIIVKILPKNRLLWKHVRGQEINRFLAKQSEVPTQQKWFIMMPQIVLKAGGNSEINHYDTSLLNT